MRLADCATALEHGDAQDAEVSTQLLDGQSLKIGDCGRGCYIGRSAARPLLQSVKRSPEPTVPARGSRGGKLWRSCDAL